MFAQVHSPQQLAPDELDRYLCRGWFRMGQTVFTTNFLNFKSQFFSAIWLRINLKQYTPDTTQVKLFRRNAAFRTAIRPATVSFVQEALYQKYKQSLTFEASASLHALMFGRSPHQIFNSHEINVYDGDKLIAAGFFDIGMHAAAGISSFYDPEYKKYSLGKYLIYQKIQFCQQQGLHYFYPGYFVPGYSYFDYKLDIGRPVLEYLAVASGAWLPIGQFTEDQIPLQIMRDKLLVLQYMLSETQTDSKILHYEYFDANLVPGLTEAELLDYPLVVHCGALDGIDHTSLVVYDVRDGRYKLIQCISVWSSEAQTSPEGFYSAHLLKIVQHLFSTHTAEEMLSLLNLEITSHRKF